MADKFYTQDMPLTGHVSYILSMPSTLWFIRQVGDLLRDITLPERWEKKGSVSIDDAVQAGVSMYLGFVPMIGQIVPYVTAAPPDNCLICDGSTYARVDYPDLYAALASVFIIDADNFVVPDLRGRTIIGMNTSYPMGSASGEAEHTLTAGEMPTHSHTDTGHVHTTGNSITLAAVMPGEGPVLTPNPIPALTGSASANLTNAGGGGAHNNMMPYVALQYAVVAR